MHQLSCYLYNCSTLPEVYMKLCLTLPFNEIEGWGDRNIALFI